MASGGKAATTMVGRHGCSLTFPANKTFTHAVPICHNDNTHTLAKYEHNHPHGDIRCSENDQMKTVWQRRSNERLWHLKKEIEKRGAQLVLTRKWFQQPQVLLFLLLTSITLFCSSAFKPVDKICNGSYSMLQGSIKEVVAAGGGWR